jgi:hypothetical protein
MNAKCGCELWSAISQRGILHNGVEGETIWDTVHGVDGNQGGCLEVVRATLTERDWEEENRLLGEKWLGFGKLW